MKRYPASKKFARKRNSSVSARRLAVERLELRLAPALLVPSADAEALARYYANTDGPHHVSHPVQAAATAAVGPILGTFQTSAQSGARASGTLISRASAGGADASTTPPADTFAISTSQSVGNWILTGPFVRGESKSVDVTLTVSGALQNAPLDPLIRQNDIRTSVAAQLLLASDFAPDQTLFDATAELGTQLIVPQISVTGPWTFTRTNPNAIPIRYETSYSATIPIMVEALEPFSLSASLETQAATAFTFEWFATTDFDTLGGLNYTLSTSEPGATIVPVGAGGTVDGTLWHDVNGNEVEDASESRLAGFRFFLDVTPDGVFDAATEPSGLTNANGVYAIPNVTPGAYDVRLELPQGWEQTSPLDTSGNPIADRVTVVDGAASTARPYGAREILADVGITITDQPDPVTVGQVLTYTINVTNNGPQTATGVTVTTSLDPNVAYVAPGVGGPPCSEAGGIVICQLGSLASGGSTSFDIEVIPSAAGTLSTTATVTANIADPNAVNDSATAMTTAETLHYALRSVDEITGPFFVFPPSINDQGTVTYITRSVASGADTILIADGAGPAAVLNSAAAFPPPAQGRLAFGFDPRINNAGTVAFSVTNNDGGATLQSGVFTVNASSALTAIRPLAGPPGFNATADINSSGTVAFYENTPTGSSRIRTSSGGQLGTVADSAGALFNNVLPWTSINDTGSAAFVAAPVGGGEGVYTSNGVVTTTIVDFSDPSPGIGWGNFFEPSIHDSGTVAFQGTFLVAGQPTAARGIFTGNGTTLTQIADSTGPYSFFQSPVLQNSGTVVFRAGLDMGGHGIFTGPDPVTDKVIATGDSLLGSTVTFVTFQQGGTNSAGQIAFQVTLQDGRNVIVVAQLDTDRDGVPDPIEDAAPNGGDGNNDAAADSTQLHVASLPNSADGSYITLVSTPGRLSGVQAIANPAPSTAPPGVTFPLGFLQFTVEGVPAPGNTQVELIPESPVAMSTYFKYGPIPGNPTPRWYRFLFDANACSANPNFCTGAELIDQNNDGLVERIVLHFVDGRRGDSDAVVGSVSDPGGPALEAPLQASISGPQLGVRGQPLAFEFNVTSPGDYRYDIDWDGDGTVDESVVGGDAVLVEHVYPLQGTYTGQVTATSELTAASAAASHTVVIEVAAVIDGNLLVGGTADDDHIHLYPRRRHEVGVAVNGNRLGPFSLPEDGQLIAFGQRGDDHILGSNRLRREVAFFGGPGDDVLRGGPADDLLDGGPGRDHLFASHGNDLLDGGDDDDHLFGLFGNNILIGGPGDDLLVGGFGRDLLIGGTGADRLFGLFGQDILIAGTTSYDSDHDSLREILAEWTRPVAYAARVEALRDTSRRVYLKKDETVLDDTSADRVFGGLGPDWFLFDPDKDELLGRSPFEAVN